MLFDLERSNASSSSVLFRGHMLSAAAQLQSALGIQDLGQLYYEPIRDQHGSTVFAIINQIKVSLLKSRWYVTVVSTGCIRGT